MSRVLLGEHTIYLDRIDHGKSPDPRAPHSIATFRLDGGDETVKLPVSAETAATLTGIAGVPTRLSLTIEFDDADMLKVLTRIIHETSQLIAAFGGAK